MSAVREDPRLHAAAVTVLKDPPYRRLTLVIWAVLVCAALTILTIGARSPYTHANLGSGYDPRYERTDQILVGAPSDFRGLSQNARPAGTDPIARGAALYVTAGCATCHAPGGRGGVVGRPIVGADEETITQRARRGPTGMPQFSTAALADDEIRDIAAYLGSLAAK